jgi:hypothetical protein
VVIADLVVAADGDHSTAVKAVPGRNDLSIPQESYNGCYRFLIPDADIASDPGLPGSLRIALVCDGNRLPSYPCRDGEFWNEVAIFHKEEFAHISCRTLRFVVEPYLT